MCMSFDPSIPAANTDLDANPIRDNFNALKTLIDAIPPPVAVLSGYAMLDITGQAVIDTGVVVNTVVACASSTGR